MQTIKSLESNLTDLESSLLPTKKFGFKSKPANSKNKSVSVPLDANDTVSQDDTVDSAISKSAVFKISCGFSDKKNESLILNEDKIKKNEVELRNLENCTIFLCGNPCAIYMNDITKCKILSGPVSTSIILENCLDSDIVVACQQLRIHSTKDSRFYIHVTSRPIIEDSDNVQFAPYNLEYETLESHFKSSALSKRLNNWNLVDDFNWLASDAHSPHWSIIPPEERVVDWF